MRSLVVAAIALAACGEVAGLHDAAIDMYVSDAGSPECLEGEMLCNNTCANVQTSSLYCGNCTTQCNALEGCLNGTCRRKNSTCADIRAFDPSATDGAYLNGNTGRGMYCDFTASTSYEFGIAQYNSPPAGFRLMRGTDFANAATQRAFIGLYNFEGGLRALVSFSGSTCCFAATPAGDEITFGGSQTYPALDGNFACSNWSTSNVYLICRSISLSGIIGLPMPDTYFSTYAPGEAAICTDNNNPAYVMKTTTF